MENVTVQIVPLVEGVEVPRAAQARTRTAIPAGYGVQEQCLPFTAASALGFLIPSPIRFGLCPPHEVPAGCHAFRSPVAGNADPRVFYVADDPRCAFSRNAFRFEQIPLGSEGSVHFEPGISFFDRADQQDLFKLHLPYIWKTPPGMDSLFLPLLNRPAHGLAVQCGLVETDWYENPVNLILRAPLTPVHCHAGDPIAQAVPIPRDLRRPSLEVAASHSRLTREARKGLAEWYRQHQADRSAYKVLARSRHGRME